MAAVLGASIVTYLYSFLVYRNGTGRFAHAKAPLALCALHPFAPQ